MKLKKNGFLLIELSIAVLVISIISVCMLEAYKRMVMAHHTAERTLKALMHLSSYIHALQSALTPPSHPDFTCSHTLIKKTPGGRAYIIKALVKWYDEQQQEHQLSLEAGIAQ